MKFQQKVFSLIAKIPKGKVSTYKQVAKALGNSKASRAVGNALHSNPFLIKIPCHRIVCSNGRIGGYALGLKKKIILLKKEGIKIKNNKILEFKEKLFSFN